MAEIRSAYRELRSWKRNEWKYSKTYGNKTKAKFERKRENKNGDTVKIRGEVSRAMTETCMRAGNYTDSENSTVTRSEYRVNEKRAVFKTMEKLKTKRKSYTMWDESRTMFETDDHA